MTDAIRKKREKDSKRFKPALEEGYPVQSVLTISEVDQLFAALDEARGKVSDIIKDVESVFPDGISNGWL